MKCTWTWSEDGGWNTECGEAFCFENDGPAENKFLHCPYCGRRLVEAHEEGSLTYDPVKSSYSIGITGWNELITQLTRIADGIDSDESQVLATVHDMAAHSLNPDTFVALEEALKELARTRKIDWVPK